MLMTGQVQQLRELIEHRLVEASSVSLVDVLAAFDHQNHCLPTTWRWNQAIAEVTEPLVLSADGTHVELSTGPKLAKLSDSDVSRVVALYLRAIQPKQPGYGA